VNSRIPNIACVLVGIVFLFVSVRSLLHHNYEYYCFDKQIRIPSVSVLFLGAWFVLYGLIGLVNSKRETAE